MKKLLPLLLFLVLVSQAQAQYKPVMFGMRIGANLDWIKPIADNYSGEGVGDLSGNFFLWKTMLF